jgi:very-short-patch-repair endonuclease
MSTVRNIVIGQKVSSTMQQTAKELRRSMTVEEKILWQRLRANRLEGLHFRRQQIIGNYVVDFYCHAAALVVELDGGIHARQIERDRERDEELVSRGMQVLRFRNEQVRHELANVLARIVGACRARTDLSP